MVLISSVKYACETCIKGHRSSACKHTDRPLFEIKKKGRPVTQCEHCRELRKTKQVHIKCMCTTKQTQPDDLHGNKKGISRTLECAAFPNGLPEAVEASVDMQLASEPSSDSDHGAGCCCKSGTECHCWTPRKTTRKSRRKVDNTNTSQAHTEPLPPLDSSQTPAHIRARIAEFRPVLPKPPKVSVDGHDPSLGHVHRYHNHETPFYSPYSRAYDHSHFANISPQSLNPQQEPAALDPSVMPWLYGVEASPYPYGSACGCGDQCRCTGCTLHNGADFTPSTTFASCMNPTACGACLNCSLLVGQTPPFEATIDYQGFDDWIRQLPSSSSFSTSMGPVQTSIPKISEPVEKGTAFVGLGHCGTVCACPAGFCQCEPDGKSCLPDFVVSPLTYQMPSGSPFAVNDTLRSRSPSTSSDSSALSSGYISTHSQGSSASLPMSTSTMPFTNTLSSGLHFWST